MTPAPDLLLNPQTHFRSVLLVLLAQLLQAASLDAACSCYYIHQTPFRSVLLVLLAQLLQGASLDAVCS
jgi:hypothetical protein